MSCICRSLYSATLRSLTLPAGNIRMKRSRSEEHTSELQSLMRTSYADFFLTKNKLQTQNNSHTELLIMKYPHLNNQLFLRQIHHQYFLTTHLSSDHEIHIP